MLGAGLLRAKRAASPAARGLFEHRVGAGTLPARGSGTAGLKLRRGRGGGLTLRPSPAMPPSPPSGLRRLRLLQRGPCATGPVIGSAGPRSRQGLQRSADGRAGLGAGVPAGWGARGGRRRLRSPVAQAAARRPLDSDPGRLAESSRGYLPSSCLLA